MGLRSTWRTPPRHRETFRAAKLRITNFARSKWRELNWAYQDALKNRDPFDVIAWIIEEVDYDKYLGTQPKRIEELTRKGKRRHPN